MIARAVFFIALLLAGPALAIDEYERFTDYKSDVTIARNGALTVTETITAVVADDEIKHGIFRDFPTTYTDRLGRRVHVDFAVLGVTRDGHKEPYDLDSIDNGERIKIGDPDTELDPGIHVFTITYSTDRQIGFFDKYDELYWNATGNLWRFAIEHAQATIHLPPGAHVVQSAFYTGGEGSTAQDATSEILSDDTIRFTTTATLGPQEGLTVAVGFNKGAVLAPTQAELRANFIRDNAGIVAALGGLLVLFVYFLAAWFEFGRDPRRGAIVPLFAPPEGLSPAAVRYIHRMAYDRKSYAATLIDMAVKGYLTISQSDGNYILTRTGKSEGECGLAPLEIDTATKLFDGDMQVEMKQDNHSQIQASISALKAALKAQYEKNYFVTNLHWFIGGLVILAITALATAFLSDSVSGNLGLSFAMLFWLSGWSFGTVFLLHRVYDEWLSVIAGPGSRILNLFSALFYTAFAVPFAGGWLFGAYMLSMGLTPIAEVALMASGIMAYVFYHLLKAPTLAGAKARDQIDGFRLFLDTTEKNRLEVLNPPDITPEVFEKFLPYAIALDCENHWSKRFEAEMAAAGQAPNAGGGYTPIWWSGLSPGGFASAGFVSGLGASLAASAASASTAPGSSSGSGGGGFSGGGGGGGGGGGW